MMKKNSSASPSVSQHAGASQLPMQQEQRKGRAGPSTELSKDALDFAPGLLAIQERPPARLPRTVLYLVAVLCFTLLLWAFFGKLDIVSSAEGKLVPQSYVKIVQPSESGSVQEILVREGEHVAAGQTLIRMDHKEASADATILQTQLATRSLQLRRVDAELLGVPLIVRAGDPPALFQEVLAQYRDRHRAYLDGLAQAQQAKQKALHDRASASENLAKLTAVTPLLKEQAQAYTDMGKDGYVPQLQMRDKQREYIEKSGELRAQQANVAALIAAENGAGEQIAQYTSKYRSDLQNERVEAQSQFQKLEQELVKQTHKNELLELKAPQAGIVNDLVAHTIGTIVSPGAVLLTLVPDREPLVAEIMVRNDDVGFVYPQQKVKIKLAPYPFQKYGMIDGVVNHVGADSSETDSGAPSKDTKKAPANAILGYKALVALNTQSLSANGRTYKLVPGMQVTAEINQGKRTVLEYLLSPIEKTMKESGRER